MPGPVDTTGQPYSGPQTSGLMVRNGDGSTVTVTVHWTGKSGTVTKLVAVTGGTAPAHFSIVTKGPHTDAFAPGTTTLAKQQLGAWGLVSITEVASISLVSV